MNIRITDTVVLQKQNDAKQCIQKDIENWLPDEKVSKIDTPTDILNILRRISSQKKRSITFRDKRAHLLAEELSFSPGSDVSIFYIGSFILSI